MRYPNMVKKQSWERFQASGMLWWANRILHVFGWAIVFEYGKLEGWKKRRYYCSIPC